MVYGYIHYIYLDILGSNGYIYRYILMRYRCVKTGCPVRIYKIYRCVLNIDFIYQKYCDILNMKMYADIYCSTINIIDTFIILFKLSSNYRLSQNILKALKTYYIHKHKLYMIH